MRSNIAVRYRLEIRRGNATGAAYSMGLGGIPYVYVAEIGGYELGANRGRLAERLPNPAVPFSYACYSLWRGTPVAQVFLPSPGASAAFRDGFASVLGKRELEGLVRAIICGEQLPEAFAAINKKTMDFVRLRASLSAPGSTLSPDQWSAALQAVQARQTLVSYLLRDARLRWSKIAYIAGLTASAKQLMNVASEYAVGLTSTKLPMCVIPPESRADFAGKVEAIYATLSQEFLAWLNRKVPLAICWVMGFKPRGDDARPDRGLPPLTRMLVGNEEDLLTVVYGPAKVATWPLLENDPAELVRGNGLWEAVLDVSDAVLADSSTDKTRGRGLLRPHWFRELPMPEVVPLLVEPAPIRIGEQDVDTVLHNVLHSYGGKTVFEGMCNPPGGDWSGLSLLTAGRKTELRWLSLPRVSASNAKRPDHVFQLFGIGVPPAILAVESKDRAADVEDKVGRGLMRYVSDLLESPASVERGIGTEMWNHSAVDFLPDNSRLRPPSPSSCETKRKRKTQCAEAERTWSWLFSSTRAEQLALSA